MITKEQSEKHIKLNAALNVVNNSILHGIDADIAFVKSILPDHYEVKESNKRGSIHCKSQIGIRKAPYTKRRREYNPMTLGYNYVTVTITDAEDNEHWEYIFKAIKQHFGKRFQEVFHNTCFCHVDFTIYLNERL